MKKLIILASALMFSFAVMAQEPVKKAEKKAAKTEKAEKSTKAEAKADTKEAKAETKAEEKKTCPNAKDGKHCGKHKTAEQPKAAPVTK